MSDSSDTVPVPEPEQIRAMQEAMRGPGEASTLEACPACACCTLCKGTHMVTPQIAAEWRVRNR